MNNKEVKLDLIHALMNRGVFCKQVNEVEYRTRCPYCGDSANENTGHLYIRINPDDNNQVVYNCFKCGESGILKPEMLSLLDISDIDLKSGLFSLNKTSDKIDKKGLNKETKRLYFDYKLPKCNPEHIKIKYIEKRLGIKLNEEDLEKMKVITSLRDFLILNNIKSITCPNNIAYKIEDKYVGFLSYGNSHILFRDITNTEKISWLKYPITEKSNENRIFYSMASVVDVMSNEHLTINLAEGVMDTLSIYYNFDYGNPNSMNISVSGRYYEQLLLFLIDLGLVGSNITINIYSDNDAKFNKKNKNPTTIEYYRKVLKNYKYLYGDINVFYNTIDKDYGVPRSNISLIKYKL